MYDVTCVESMFIPVAFLGIPNRRLSLKKNLNLNFQYINSSGLGCALIDQSVMISFYKFENEPK